MKLLPKSLFTMVALVATLGWPALAAAAEPTPAAKLAGPIHQLRLYEIFDNNKQQFHDRFRDHAMRIMARHGFKIITIWETRHGNRTEFAYLLEWPDKAAMTRAWAGFMADKEWADIKKATNREGSPMVGDIQDRALVLTDYSPKRVLLP